MKHTIIYIIFLILMSCNSSSGDGKKLENSASGLKSHQTYKPEQLQEDFNILITTLKETHPDLYRVASKEVINSRLSEIEQAIQQPLSYLEFLKYVALLFTDIGCINTQWGHSEDFISFRNDSIPIFPLQIEIRDQRFFVKSNFSNDSTIKPGMEILEFNGEKPTAYLEKNYSLLPVDGKIRTIQERWLEAYFPNHHSNFWEQPDTFNLLLKDTTGNIYGTSIAALLKSQFVHHDHGENKNLKPLRFSIEERVAVLTLESFNKTRIRSYKQDFKLFIDSCFSELNKKSIKKLVIDLRGNGWGDFSYGALLLSYLAKEPFVYIEDLQLPHDTHFTFRQYTTAIPDPDTTTLIPLTKEIKPQPKAFHADLYLITNGWDVNAKGFFCAKVKERPNTFFAGEECGATTFGMNGYPLTLKLPNTGIQVWIPTVQMIANKNDYPSVHGVPLNFTPEDSDSIISATLRKINNY